MNSTNQDPLQEAQLIKQSILKPKNYNKLIDIVSHHSNAQRQNIVQRLLIFDDLKSELSGHFKEAVIALFYPSNDYDCYQLYKAMKGLGTNEDTLIEIIDTRSNNNILMQLKQDIPRCMAKTYKAILLAFSDKF